jgi:YD repeat-containing protein
MLTWGNVVRGFVGLLSFKRSAGSQAQANHTPPAPQNLARFIVNIWPVARKALCSFRGECGGVDNEPGMRFTSSGLRLLQLLTRQFARLAVLSAGFFSAATTHAQTIDDFGFEPPRYFVYAQSSNTAGATHPVPFGGPGNVQATKDESIAPFRNLCEVYFPSLGYKTQYIEEEIAATWMWRAVCKLPDENRELTYAYVRKIGVCSAEAPFEYNFDFLRAVTMTPPTANGLSFGWIACGFLKTERRTAGPQCPQAGNPICIGPLNKYQFERDISSSSAIPFARSYNTVEQRNLGGGWTHTFSIAIVSAVQITSQVLAVRSDGVVNVYDLALPGTWVTFSDVNEKLEELTDANGARSGWKLTTPEDTVERYDAKGVLQSITRRSGYAQTLQYDATSKLLTKVVDSYGRSLTFTYFPSVVPYLPAQIASITDNAGKAVSYTYALTGNAETVTYPDGKVRKYLYNEPAFMSGRDLPSTLTGIVDENNIRFATYTYSGGGYPASTSYANAANQYSLSPGSGNSRTVVDPIGASRYYDFQRVNGLYKNTYLTQPCGTPGCAGQVASSMTYDANANLASKIDFNNNKTCYQYDLSRNLETGRIEGLPSSADCTASFNAATLAAPARKINTVWHPTYRLPVTIVEPILINGTTGTKVTTHTHDANTGDLLQRDVTTTQGTRTWKWTYETLGRIKTATDPRNNTTTHTYYPNTAAQNTTLANSRGMLASITNALGHTTAYTAYDANGRVLSMTDANGLVTTMTYHPRGWLLSRTTTGTGIALTTTYDYDGVGQLTKVTMPDSSFMTYTYDDAHRLTKITDTLNNSITYTLDAMGNRIGEFAKDPSGALTRAHTREIDVLNRLAKDIGATNPATQFTTYGYDNNGNQKSIKDALGRVTDNDYDALNRLVKVTEPTVTGQTPTRGITQYDYDAQDNLIKVTDAKNLATTYAYNGFNELLSQTSPDTGVSTFTYDAAGNILTKTDARDKVAKYRYDNLNRVTSIRYFASSAQATADTPVEQTVTYSYDGPAASCPNGKGRLCSLTDKTGSTTFSYDMAGRLTSKAQTTLGVTPPLTQTIAYRYNAAGQMDEMTLPSGKKVAYSYLNNRITGVSYDGTPIVKNAGYEPFGPVGEWLWGNDTASIPNKSTRDYDLDGRVFRIDAGPANGSIEPTQLVYNDVNQITGIQRLTPAGVPIPAKSNTYGYDSLDRLTGVTPNSGNPNPALAYSYDAIGNRLSATVGAGGSTSTTNYNYGTTSHRLNNLTGAITKTYSYDAGGNRIGDGAQTWNYGADNRPATISVTGTNSATIEAGINALGQRITKKVNGNLTRFMYDEAGRLLGEYTDTGQPIQETIWFNDLPVAVIK